MLLRPYIDYEKRKILSHSFRAGMASMMASAGYQDHEIMRQAWMTNDALFYRVLVGWLFY